MLTESMKFPSGSGQCAGYYAKPDGGGPFAGLVIIHEAFGLNENIREITERFAGEGYAALAVDLFGERNRAICMARYIAGMLLNSLDHQGIHDRKAALTYLSALPEVDGARVGAVGYCLGGSFAIAWACTDNRLKAIAPYYAMNPRPAAAIERLCPVVGSYPEEDFTAGADKKLDIELDAYEIPHDIKIYPESKHSFFNDHGPNYNADVTRDSWNRVRAFFKSHIG